MVVRPDFIARRVRLEKQFDEVRVVLVCDDEYMASVVFNDIEERAARGETIVLTLPPNKERKG